MDNVVPVRVPSYYGGAVCIGCVQAQETLPRQRHSDTDASTQHSVSPDVRQPTADRGQGQGATHIGYRLSVPHRVRTGDRRNFILYSLMIMVRCVCVCCLLCVCAGVVL